ncbi:MAG: hypothetical protein IT289_11480 [Oligoflexia bacterium]|nr:hypothetical protein [Oligoflexia bacterium]
MKLIPRHSVASAHDYNAFFSDVDYTIVVRDQITDCKMALIIDAFSLIFSNLPFLGELEIHTATEYEMRNKIAYEFKTIIEILWLLRKWKWQVKLLEKNLSRYHREKAQRSIEKISMKLGASGEQPCFGPFIEGELATLFPTLSFEPSVNLGPIYIEKTNYFEWSLSTDINRDSLVLTPNSILILVAILPYTENLSPVVKNELKKVLQVPEVIKVKRAIAQYELLAFQSVKRIYGHKDGNWEKHLRNVLGRETDPPR